MLNTWLQQAVWHKLLAAACMCAALIGCKSMSVMNTSQSAPSAEQLLRIPYTSSLDNTPREYLVYLPQGYADNPDKDWPVMLFLHGNGERGDGLSELDFVMAHGPLYEAWIQKQPLPFIIISPQLHMFDLRENGPDYIKNRTLDSLPKRLENGVPERGPMFTRGGPMDGVPQADMSKVDITLPIGWNYVEQDLLGMLTHAHANYRTDASRVYLTGLSYGGFGAWYMASKHPQLFAAIAPVVGWGHPDLMAPIAEHKIPVWQFAAGRDYSVRIQYFYAGLNKLEELGHDNVRFTNHEDMAHDAWRRVYRSKDFYDWLLEHKLVEQAR
ncbi:prolyl oligopeptidase family serine peptidase [Saccharophagus degradans]|uniref:carboxylesterase family protein n=1 Tax=Saccharophagus degradans TaxID=86304 RepID=UPI001C085A19|nr:alpha/beta hydrolase-fold protein [Saccharophagus degradans]MBU2984938.1 prolyl oligopeptidase family serine peptidase [Saccharophagus degradans]